MIDFLTLFSGRDIPFQPLRLQIHQPRLSEIGLLGEADFFTAAHYLCLDKKRLPQNQNHELDNFSNFQILQSMLKLSSQQTGTNIKVLLINLLALLVPTHRVTITPNGFLLYNTSTKETCSIDDSNFEEFKELINEILCLSKILRDDEGSFNPQGKRAEAIAKKIMAGRQKVAQINAKKNDSRSIIARYVSILSIALSIPEQDILDKYTLCQLFDSMKRYEMKQASDIDLQVRLTGTKPDKEVDNWMDDIHKLNEK